MDFYEIAVGKPEFVDRIRLMSTLRYSQLSTGFRCNGLCAAGRSRGPKMQISGGKCGGTAQKKNKKKKTLTKLRKQITSSQAGRHNTRQRMMAIIDTPRKTEGLNTESDNEGN